MKKNFLSIAIIISMLLILTGCTSHKALQQESKTGGSAETLTTDNDESTKSVEESSEDESDVNVTIKDISYDDFIEMRMEDKMQYDDYAIIVENDALTYEQRQRLLWGDEQISETRTVDVHIGTLRTKLGECGRYIETVRGVGYKMREKE